MGRLETAPYGWDAGGLLTLGGGSVVAAVFAVASTTHPECGATWFVCFVAIFGTVGASGLYMIGAVYFGWPIAPPMCKDSEPRRTPAD